MSAVLAEPKPPNHIDAAVSERQLEMIQHPAKVLWIGCGTKTGKTTALAMLVAQSILRNKQCAWIGPWSARTRQGYNAIKNILAVAVQSGSVKCNDSDMRIRSVRGGFMEPHTGDNPGAIYGSEYDLIVIDEASRQGELSYQAAITTSGPRQGKIRLAFNLEHGAQNWAIRNLLRVRKMDPAERVRANEDYLMFPTLDEAFVPPEEVEFARKTMAPQIFDALYNAIIPSWDTSLFRNIAEVFSGVKVDGPMRGHEYVMGVDLARKANYTVATVLDVTSKQAVDAIRFNEISWTLQYSRIADLYAKWGCRIAAVDATGLGDPVVEELARRNIKVDPVVFTPKVRHELIELLIVAFDQQEIHVSNDKRFEAHRAELSVFEPKMNKKGEVTYGPPDNEDDDCVFSLALAWRCLKLGNFGRPRIARGDTTRLAVRDYAGY